MIGRLHGKIIEKQPPEMVLDVQGIGYEILLPMTSFYDLPQLGEETTIFTHLVVREDAHLLFGFAQKQDRTLFRELIKTNGGLTVITIFIRNDQNLFADHTQQLFLICKDRF